MTWILVSLLPQGFLKQSSDQWDFGDVCSRGNMPFPQIPHYLPVHGLLHFRVPREEIHCPGQRERCLIKKPADTGTWVSKIKDFRCRQHRTWSHGRISTGAKPCPYKSIGAFYVLLKQKMISLNSSWKKNNRDFWKVTSTLGFKGSFNEEPQEKLFWNFLKSLKRNLPPLPWSLRARRNAGQAWKLCLELSSTFSTRVTWVLLERTWGCPSAWELHPASPWLGKGCSDCPNLEEMGERGTGVVVTGLLLVHSSFPCTYQAKQHIRIEWHLHKAVSLFTPLPKLKNYISGYWE